MKINSYIDSLRTPPANQTATPRPAQEVAQAPAARPAKSDSVQISDAGRRMNAEQRDAPDPTVWPNCGRKFCPAPTTPRRGGSGGRRILTRGDL